jgi:hypothetical protein
MSGSLVGSSLLSYWHLALIALREGSPLPSTHDMAERWSRVVDVDASPADYDLAYFAKLGRTQKEIRRALGRRLIRTPGVVWQTKGFDDVPLVMFPVKHQVTEPCLAAIRKLNQTWELPDGEPLVDATDVGRHLATLPWGFYLAWDWDAIGGYDAEWNEARLEWARVQRNIRSWGDRELDSLTTIVAAVKAGKLPEAAPAYEAWEAVRHRPEPPKVVRYVDHTAVVGVLDLVDQMGEGIVWFRSPALGELLAACGIPTYGRGDGFPKQAPVVALNSQVYGTGTDGLQMLWHRNLVLQPPSDYEQLIGRTHRSGQTETVRMGVVTATQHQARSLHFSKVKAEVSADLSASDKKILSARWRNQPEWD